jgi:hypothetical protein
VHPIDRVVDRSPDANVVERRKRVEVDAVDRRDQCRVQLIRGFDLESPGLVWREDAVQPVRGSSPHFADGSSKGRHDSPDDRVRVSVRLGSV